MMPNTDPVPDQEPCDENTENKIQLGHWIEDCATHDKQVCASQGIAVHPENNEIAYKNQATYP